MKHALSCSLVILILSLLAAPAIAAGGYGLWDWYIIPAAASNPGVNGTYWRLDISILNPYSWRPITVKMWFLAEKKDNSIAPVKAFTINPGAQVTLADVVGSQFGVTGKGALLLDTADGAYFTTNARSYTTSSGGTYGHEVPGQYMVRGPNAKAFTAGIRVDSVFRTNIGAVNGSRSSITVRADVLDTVGSIAGSYTFNLPPFGTEQVAVSSFSSLQGPGSIRWTCVSSNSGVEWVAYATPVDNASGDAIYLEERGDNQYTNAQPAWDLTGRWQGTMSVVGGRTKRSRWRSHRTERPSTPLSTTQPKVVL